MIALLDYIITEIIVGTMVYIGGGDTVNRIPALVALIIAFLIVRPTAIEEWRQDDKRTADVTVIDEDQFM